MTDAKERDVVLGRTADPDAVETLPFPGGCRCPGTPHAVDRFTFRTELGAGETKAVRVAGWAATDGEYYDWEAANDVLIGKAVISWDLLTLVPCTHPGKSHRGGDAVSLPINRRTASLLDEPSRLAILTAVNASFDSYQARLPNASGEPSPDGSPESSSPTQTTSTPDSSTT